MDKHRMHAAEPDKDEDKVSLRTTGRVFARQQSVGRTLEPRDSTTARIKSTGGGQGQTGSCRRPPTQRS